MLKQTSVIVVSERVFIWCISKAETVINFVCYLNCSSQNMNLENWRFELFYEHSNPLKCRKFSPQFTTTPSDRPAIDPNIENFYDNRNRSVFPATKAASFVFAEKNRFIFFSLPKSFSSLYRNRSYFQTFV